MDKYLVCAVIAVFANIVDADSECGIVPISQWSDKSLQRTERLQTPINFVVIQHTATSSCDTDEACKEVLLFIRTHHIKDLNFTDIGNSFLVGGNGKVYEGAGWHRIGAHTRGYNDKAISISFIGNFINMLPTPEALKTAQDLIGCGVKTNYLARDYKLVGHGQLSATLSPGDSLQRLIESWSHWTKFT